MLKYKSQVNAKSKLDSKILIWTDYRIFLLLLNNPQNFVIFTMVPM
jgi:hypothetical protein